MHWLWQRYEDLLGASLTPYCTTYHDFGELGHSLRHSFRTNGSSARLLPTAHTDRGHCLEHTSTKEALWSGTSEQGCPYRILFSQENNIIFNKRMKKSWQLDLQYFRIIFLTSYILVHFLCHLLKIETVAFIYFAPGIRYQNITLVWRLVIEITWKYV